MDTLHVQHDPTPGDAPPVCSVCRGTNPDQCRHPIHWPDRDPEAPYFPDAEEVYLDPAWTDEDVRAHVIGSFTCILAERIVTELLDMNEARAIAACWAADARATPPGGLRDTAARWVPVAR